MVWGPPLLHTAYATPDAGPADADAGSAIFRLLQVHAEPLDPAAVLPALVGDASCPRPPRGARVRSKEAELPAMAALALEQGRPGSAAPPRLPRRRRARPPATAPHEAADPAPASRALAGAGEAEERRGRRGRAGDVPRPRRRAVASPGRSAVVLGLARGSVAAAPSCCGLTGEVRSEGRERG
jgi:hypothetical protein